MFFEIPGLGPALANVTLIGILVHVIIEDMRRYRIYNRAVISLGVMFLLSQLIVNDWETFTAHLTFGAAMSAVMLIVYMLRLMGGGDIKLLMVSFFWLGQENFGLFLIFMASLLMLYVIGVKAKLLPARESAGKLHIPFAPAIAGAWIAVAALEFVT